MLRIWLAIASTITACRARWRQSLRLLIQENSTAKSNYNSLQASLRITEWHGFTSIATYVWSHAIG